MSIVIVISLAVIFVIAVSLFLKYLQPDKTEAFSQMFAPLTLGENQGIPLIFLNSIQAPITAYYKELDSQSITKLVSKATNLVTIDSFISHINSWLPSFDRFTADVPFKVVSQKDITSTTKQLVIYRDGKMYGFVVEVVIGKGATVTGFVLEQDIKVNSGFDPLGSNIRLYDSDAKEFSRKDVISTMQQEIDAMLQKQSDALLQDRGISSVIHL